ncbi:lipocalin-like domain-containing protein [Speluncibacter jeojiensis]|uniref:AttH domain-containing protein n=1 Tax=Speluncibacter jeojiensis TaxID=2710754 RepID=A0A9X4M1K5_9ACTN|nr:hypothetical protein [Corynebacteriales bacterium D3-21]
MAVKNVVEAWSGPGRRDGTITALRPADNAAHPSTDKHAFEHWYFDARLDDGHIVVGFFQGRELVSRKPGVELHIYSPDGTRREIVRHYSDEQVSASPDECRIRIGDNTAESDHTGPLPVHRIHLAEEDVAFDLTFHSEVPGWMPGRGQTSYGDREFFAWAVGAPRARVSGTVRIGDRVLDATGLGYHDHNWGVGDMKRIIDRWYWGRLYVDDLTLIYATVLTQKGYGAHWSTPLMLALGDRVVLSTGEIEVRPGPMRFDAVANREYPTSLRLVAPGQVDLSLNVRRIVHAHDFLADVPVVRTPLVKPLVNRLVGRPGYFRFESDFTLSATVDGQRFEREGSTLHEMVALK